MEEQLNMRIGMGNQNTSGIVEEDRAANEAQEEPQHTSYTDDSVKVMNHEEETAEIDAPSIKTRPAERLTSDEIEEVNGSVNEDEKIREASLHDDASSSNEESEEMNTLELQLCKFNNEVQDRSSDLKGVIHTSNSTLKPHEAIEITSEPQEPTSMLANMAVGTLKQSYSGQIEEQRGFNDAKVVESLGSSLVLNIDDHEADIKGYVSELSTDTEKLEMPSTYANIENVISNERRYDHPKEEMDKRYDTCESFVRIGSLDLTAPRNEILDKPVVLADERMHELLRNGDNSTFGMLDQETNPLFASSDARIQSEMQKIGTDHPLSSPKMADIFYPGEANDVAKEIGSVQSEKLTPTSMNQDDDISTRESIQDKVTCFEKRDCQESVISRIDPEQTAQPITTEVESKGQEKAERLVVESNEYNGVNVQLRKSSSFDFGVPIGARSEESDQTPLLYQDRTALKSLCKAIDQVEEKTITMEKNNSGNSRAQFLKLIQKEEKSITDEKQEYNLKTLRLDEKRAIASPNGNGKRKQRSSLFTACICCTADVTS